ncbi:MAG TPA: class I SAM-dependent methyltransferase [Acidimicrobiales bacterium]
MTANDTVVVAERFHDFVCPSCGGPLEFDGDGPAIGSACGWTGTVVGGIVRFVADSTHENFGIQWNEFADVQIDDLNGTADSRERLLNQSGLRSDDWRGKRVLEVGCGAGRFTRLMLQWGARVVAVDYSRAIEACVRNNADAVTRGRLVPAQADIFALPLRAASFDIVVCYGVLHHTGDARRALHSLWRHVAPDGLLLVDRYQLSLRRVMPFKYLLRPVLKRLPPAWVKQLAETTVRVLSPGQRSVLRAARRLGTAGKFIRYVLHRSPNSVYPFELEIDKGLPRQVATRWSVLDTFDQWAPAYDSPCTLGAWRRQLASLPGGRVVRAFSCGQGNAGVVKSVDKSK